MNATLEPNSTPEKGSFEEIILPPVSIIITGFLALSLLAICSSRYCRNYRKKKCVRPTNSSFTSISSFLSDVSQESNVFTDDTGFYSRGDIFVLEHLQTFQNNPKHLYKIPLPSVMSLVACPLIMLAYGPIVNFLWPNQVQPAINEAVACFLAPAGMVYAVSFGFAFQQVLEKQIDITARLNSEFGEIEQLMNLTKNLSSVSQSTRIKMYLALKKEIFTITQFITEMPVTEINEGGSIWSILDYLRELPSSQQCVDKAIVHKIVKYVGSINNIADKCGTLHARIHPLQWAFLETLGYFSFMGIQLVKCDSYRLEMCMSLVTALSISISCYIVADIDNPFHGFFRIDLLIIINILQKLERYYIEETHSKIGLESMKVKKMDEGFLISGQVQTLPQ